MITTASAFAPRPSLFPAGCSARVDSLLRAEIRPDEDATGDGDTSVPMVTAYESTSRTRRNTRESRRGFSEDRVTNIVHRLADGEIPGQTPTMRASLQASFGRLAIQSSSASSSSSRAAIPLAARTSWSRPIATTSTRPALVPRLALAAVASNPRRSYATETTWSLSNVGPLRSKKTVGRQVADWGPRRDAVQHD